MLIMTLVAVSLLGGDAMASGRIRRIPLDQAVRRADFVLVVKTAKPAWERRKAYVPVAAKKHVEIKTSFYRVEVVAVLHKDRAMASKITGDSRLRVGKRHSFMSKNLTVGRVFRVMNNATVTSHGVRARYEATGVRKIPYYDHLADGAKHKDLEKGGRFVFVGSYSVAYEGLKGVGAWGLVPISKLARVRKLLSAKKKTR